MSLNKEQKITIAIGLLLSLSLFAYPWVAYQFYDLMPDGRPYFRTHEGIVAWWHSPLDEMALLWAAIIAATLVCVMWFGDGDRANKRIPEKLIWTLMAICFLLSCLFPHVQGVYEISKIPPYTVDGVTYDGDLFPRLRVYRRFLSYPAERTVWEMVLDDWALFLGLGLLSEIVLRGMTHVGRHARAGSSKAQPANDCVSLTKT